MTRFGELKFLLVTCLHFSAAIKSPSHLIDPLTQHARSRLIRSPSPQPGITDGVEENDDVVLVTPTSDPLEESEDHVDGHGVDVDIGVDEGSSGLLEPASPKDKRQGWRLGELYLPPDYNKLEIPRSPYERQGKPVETPVSLHVAVRQISEINEEHEEVEFVMDVVVEWLDQALLTANFKKEKREREAAGEAWDPEIDEQQRVIDPVFLHKIWKPDIFIGNVVRIRQTDFMGKPARLKFASDGLVTYITRVRVRVGCEFDFEFYPADTQECDVSFRSYSHNSSSLELVWQRPVGVYFLYPDDDNFDVAVGSLDRFRLPARLHRHLTTNETFDTLQFTFFARRRLSYHLVQTYVPSMLYIATAGLCFMVPRRMIEARLAITMTTLLTLTAMFASVRERAPLVSYTKAIDTWMLVCIAFVFLVLLHFSLLLWTETQRSEQKGYGIRKIVLEICGILVEFIEQHSFLLILSTFFTFNALYWSSLLMYSGYFEWNPDPINNGIGKTLRSEKEGHSLNLFSDDEFWKYTK